MAQRSIAIDRNRTKQYRVEIKVKVQQHDTYSIGLYWALATSGVHVLYPNPKLNPTWSIIKTPVPATPCSRILIHDPPLHLIVQGFKGPRPRASGLQLQGGLQGYSDDT